MPLFQLLVLPYNSSFAAFITHRYFLHRSGNWARCLKPQRQGLWSTDTEPFHPCHFPSGPDKWRLLKEQRLQGDRGLYTRQLRPQTIVNAVAKSQVVTRVAQHVETIRL